MERGCWNYYRLGNRRSKKEVNPESDPFSAFPPSRSEPLPSPARIIAVASWLVFCFHPCPLLTDPRRGLPMMLFLYLEAHNGSSSWVKTQIFAATIKALHGLHPNPHLSDFALDFSLPACCIGFLAVPRRDRACSWLFSGHSLCLRQFCYLNLSL